MNAWKITPARYFYDEFGWASNTRFMIHVNKVNEGKRTKGTKNFILLSTNYNFCRSSARQNALGTKLVTFSVLVCLFVFNQKWTSTLSKFKLIKVSENWSPLETLSSTFRANSKLPFEVSRLLFVVCVFRPLRFRCFCNWANLRFWPRPLKRSHFLERIENTM